MSIHRGCADNPNHWGCRHCLWLCPHAQEQFLQLLSGGAVLCSEVVRHRVPLHGNERVPGARLELLVECSMVAVGVVDVDDPGSLLVQLREKFRLGGVVFGYLHLPAVRPLEVHLFEDLRVSLRDPLDGVLDEQVVVVRQENHFPKMESFEKKLNHPMTLLEGDSLVEELLHGVVSGWFPPKLCPRGEGEEVTVGILSLPTEYGAVEVEDPVDLPEEFGFFHQVAERYLDRKYEVAHDCFCFCFAVVMGSKYNGLSNDFDFQFLLINLHLIY